MSAMLELVGPSPAGVRPYNGERLHESTHFVVFTDRRTALAALRATACGSTLRRSFDVVAGVGTTTAVKGSMPYGRRRVTIR